MQNKSSSILEFLEMSQSLTSLPTELVSRIFSHATKETLKNAVLCSRDWYEIVVPHLYHRLQITTEDTAPNALQALTALILRKPELGAHVRHFIVRPAFDDNGPYREEATAKESISETLTQAKDLDAPIKDAIKTTSHSDDEHARWLEDINCEDALLAVLIPLFKRLETLDLEVGISPYYVPRTLWRIGRGEKPFDEQPTLTRLHSILWAHNDNKYGGSKYTSSSQFIGTVYNFL